MTDWNSLIGDFGSRIREKRQGPVVQKAYGAKPLVGHEAFSVPTLVTEPPPKSPLSQAKTRRMDDVLSEIAKAVLTRFGHNANNRRNLFDAFDTAVVKYCDKLVAAASIPKTELERVTQQRIAFNGERKAHRKALADELKPVRKKLQALRGTLEKVRGQVAVAQARVCHDATLYPAVPDPEFPPSREGSPLPAESGIYFLWKDDAIEYVGKSIRLCDRVKLGSHHVLTRAHRISYVCIPLKDLTWAECYYIGALRPLKNFGSRASHHSEGQ